MDYFKYGLLIFLVICAISVSLSKKLINTIIIFMSYSCVMSIIWVMLESPDLAITEAAVGAGVSSILFFVTLKKIHAVENEELVPKSKDIAEAEKHWEMKVFSKAYKFTALIVCVSIIIILLSVVSQLPRFGNPSNPDNNEVVERYITRGLQETGAVNIVTGMILDYRAFDTFGESCVLFIAATCVMILLRVDTESGDLSMPSGENDRLYEPKNDLILQKIAKLLVPIIMLFGVYVILNGHLSPGGGFSGGAIIGAGLILYLNANGFQKTERFFTSKLYKTITCSALTFYCFAKSYSFFTGANHLESMITPGTPGAIISSGLILPLNICVGLVVSCTMYSFYAFFRKGNL
ncbi:MAG: DUF4040 domain-containing protein [Oscillospiraceae bacterium]